MPSILLNPTLNHHHLHLLNPSPTNSTLPSSLLPHPFLNPPPSIQVLLVLLLHPLIPHPAVKVGNGILKLKLKNLLLHPLNLPPPKVLSSKREVTLEEESKRKFNMSFMSIA